MAEKMSKINRAFVRLALAMLWLYKRTLSPMLYFFGVRCRHEPGCSDYSVEALKRFGAWRGFWMTVARFTRCHPFGTHGYDPVPEEQPEASLKIWRFGRWGWRG